MSAARREEESQGSDRVQINPRRVQDRAQRGSSAERGTGNVQTVENLPEVVRDGVYEHTVGLKLLASDMDRAI